MFVHLCVWLQIGALHYVGAIRLICIANIVNLFKREKKLKLIIDLLVVAGACRDGTRNWNLI